MTKETVLSVLESLARTMGISLDHAAARDALGEAERAIPGDWRQTWPERLERVGRDLGLRIEPTDRPPAEAIREAHARTPALLFAPGPRGSGRWLIATDRRGRWARVVEIRPGQQAADAPERWMRGSALERSLGEVEHGRPGVALVQAMAPFQQIHTPEAREDNPDYPTPLARTLALLRPEKKDIRVVVAFTIGIGVLSLAMPLTVEALVMTVAYGTVYQQVIVLSVILFVCMVLAAVMRILRYYVMEVIQRRVYVRLVSDLAHRLPRAKIEAFDHHHGPELVNRFFDVINIQKALALLFTDGLGLVLQILVGLILLAFYHPFLLAFDLALALGILLIATLAGRGAVRTAIAESTAKYETADWLEELARHPTTFKHEGGPRLAWERADRVARTWLANRSKHFQIVLGQVVSLDGLQVLAAVGILSLGGWLVIVGEVTLGQLVAAELVIATSTSSLVKLGKYFELYYDLQAGVFKIGKLIDLPLEPPRGEERPAPPGRGAELHLHEVCYAYEALEDGHAHGLPATSFDVEPGARVAVIGRDGSGRSTLVDLLSGRRAPTGGRMILDGADVRELHPERLREQAVAVRKPEIFHGSIIENVRMGRDELSLDDIQWALEQVGLLDDLAGFPEGLNTGLTTGGRPLSEGQARRLTLARAIAGRPRLLVLDQTLDGLDPGVREPTIEAILDRSQPWSLVVTTHSLDVARRCDRTIALGDAEAAGPLVELLPPDSVEHPSRPGQGRRPPSDALGGDDEIPPRGAELPALRLVQSLGTARVLSKVVLAVLIISPFVLAFVPWRQSVQGNGRVVAFSPLDRQQAVKAPIDGRVMQWWVVEGTHVEAGDKLFEIRDNDPNFLQRLELLVQASRGRLDAIASRKQSLIEVLEAYDVALETAVTAAGNQLDVAVQNVESTRQSLEAAEAALRAAEPDFERKRRAAAEGLVSIQEFQFAERAFLEAQAEVDGTRAKLAAAEDEVEVRRAELERIRAEAQGRIEVTRADLETTEAELATAQKELTNAEIDIARQSRRLVLAPRAGTIFRILAGQDTEIVNAGDPLALLVPDFPDPMSRTVELYLDGRDVPLLLPGSEVRLQFEGWPAVQFVGWPSVAVGTFPGRVTMIDPADDGTGKYRVLVTPSPDDGEDWPSGRFLRQGVQVKGWVLLRQVSLGYEIWRRINGFPPFLSLEKPDVPGTSDIQPGSN